MLLNIRQRLIGVDTTVSVISENEIKSDLKKQPSVDDLNDIDGVQEKLWFDTDCDCSLKEQLLYEIF